MIVLGIDPGSRATGWGVVRVRDRRVEPVAHGVIKVGAGALPARLVTIGRALTAVLDEHAPALVVVEQAFHAKNARSTLVLGHVRGLVLWLAAGRGTEVAEFAPRAVKLSVTGNGAASKPQVAAMVQRLLALPRVPAADAADALAVALCGVRRSAFPRSVSSAGSAEGELLGSGAPSPTRTARSVTGETIDLSRAFSRARRSR